MDIRSTARPTGTAYAQWVLLLRENGLTPDERTEQTVLVYDGDELIAAGSRDGSLLKGIVTRRHGEDLTAAVLTALRRDAFEHGHTHLFLYTKPQNEALFAGLLFTTVVRTARVVLMEDKRDGIAAFLAQYPAPCEGGSVGALVMNCDPFTRGHRYLIETAAAECDRVLVFVLSEDKGHTPAADRLLLVQRGTADLPNVTVLPSGPYLISAATFPTYFLPDRDTADAAYCDLDIAVFTQHFIPHFHITRRYVGTEPLSALTAQYNARLRELLPIEVREIERLTENGEPVSASTVRRLCRDGDWDAVARLVPPTTYTYLTGGSTSCRNANEVCT